MASHADIIAGIKQQAAHCATNDAPITGSICLSLLDLLEHDSACGRRVAQWPGNVIEDAMPLRFAGGLHNLHLSGAALELAPLYAGEIGDQETVNALVRSVVDQHDARLLPWFDGPPQTNEGARSANFAAACLWLVQQLGLTRFELLELGSSAGATTLFPHYRFNLGGTMFGPADSPVQITPQWRGNPPPPPAECQFLPVRGCDLNPIDLTNDAELLRLKSYIWPEMPARFARIDAIADIARQNRPDITQADAADWFCAQLGKPQEAGTIRALIHSITWQYIPAKSQKRIEQAMAEAGAQATPERPLAWIALETNRETMRHELHVRYWPGGQTGGETPNLLGQAHAHGEWIEWAAE